MSGLLYDSYCYETQQNLIDNVLSEPFYGFSTYTAHVMAASVITSSTIRFTVNLVTNTGVSSNININRTFPVCSQVGYSKPASLTPQELSLIGVDSASILYIYSWGMGAILSIWALGYALSAALKMLKKL